MFDKETMQMAGAGVAAMLVGIFAWIGKKKGDPSPPDVRPLTPNEIKEALSEIRNTLRRLEKGLVRFGEVHEEQQRDAARQLDRIENRVSYGPGAFVQHHNDRTIPPR